MSARLIRSASGSRARTGRDTRRGACAQARGQRGRRSARAVRGRATPGARSAARRTRRQVCAPRQRLPPGARRRRRRGLGRLSLVTETFWTGRSDLRSTSSSVRSAVRPADDTGSASAMVVRVRSAWGRGPVRLALVARLRGPERSGLPDRVFAYVDARGIRHLPIHDASHVRNALARFQQTRFETDTARDRARDALLRAAQRFRIVPVGFIANELDAAARARGTVPSLPTGFVTLLMTDVEGSTRLVQRIGPQFGELVDEVWAAQRRAVSDAGGYEVEARAGRVLRRVRVAARGHRRSHGDPARTRSVRRRRGARPRRRAQRISHAHHFQLCRPRRQHHLARHGRRPRRPDRRVGQCSRRGAFDECPRRSGSSNSAPTISGESADPCSSTRSWPKAWSASSHHCGSQGNQCDRRARGLGPDSAFDDRPCRLMWRRCRVGR